MTRKLRDAARRGRVLALEIYKEWVHDNASLLAAAVAFYATFSVAPLLILIVAITSEFVGSVAARDEVVGVIARFINPRTAVAVERLLAPAVRGNGTNVTIVSAILLVAGASGVFRHLRIALNMVLDVPTTEERYWWNAIQTRLVAVVMVVVTLVLLLSSVALTSVLSTIRRFVPTIPTADVAIWRAIDLAITTVLVAALFAGILKFVPDARLAWRNVRSAAMAAAILFGAGRYALGVYLARTNITTLYGAAASLFVVLVAIYFAVLVLVLAAELTEVLARRDPEFAKDREQRQRKHRHLPRKLRRLRQRFTAGRTSRENVSMNDL
ncbi:MAG TPA: YihY/virulence factor BrkB family protein [Thermoanaerobaculia bacterium]|nr:YihY/virulence factor BrkB family protein [Thermoanaerobaculia bacterium]